MENTFVISIHFKKKSEISACYRSEGSLCDALCGGAPSDATAGGLDHTGGGPNFLVVVIQVGPALLKYAKLEIAVYFNCQSHISILC